jgi:hypothetical protein
MHSNYCAARLRPYRPEPGDELEPFQAPNPAYLPPLPPSPPASLRPHSPEPGDAPAKLVPAWSPADQEKWKAAPAAHAATAIDEEDYGSLDEIDPVELSFADPQRLAWETLPRKLRNDQVGHLQKVRAATLAYKRALAEVCPETPLLFQAFMRADEARLWAENAITREA